jgi:uncharacterized protein (DUF1810 family)
VVPHTAGRSDSLAPADRIWFVLPQLRGLGRSAVAAHYGMADQAEARAYLADPVLRQRLEQVIAVIAEQLQQPGQTQSLQSDGSPRKDAAKAAMSLVNELDEGQTLKDLLLGEVETAQAAARQTRMTKAKSGGLETIQGSQQKTMNYISSYRFFERERPHQVSSNGLAIITENYFYSINFARQALLTAAAREPAEIAAACTNRALANIGRE